MISIGINLILGMLLTCALILGVRLEKKLRGLRQSHADFAKAVSELDGAASRTEASLQALRAGTEAAKGELASRIDQARIACQRLEKLSAEAERLANQPLPLAHPMAPPSLSQAAVGMSALARPEAAGFAPEPMRPAAPVQTRPAPTPVTARSRARSLDDDLFSLEPPPAARKVEFDAFIPERPIPEAAFIEPAFPESAFIEPAYFEPAIAGSRMAEPTVVPFRADNDPLVGAPKMDRAAREAFYREVLERETSASDPFESDSHFTYERRAMLAAVMGGRR